MLIYVLNIIALIVLTWLGLRFLKGNKRVVMVNSLFSTIFVFLYPNTFIATVFFVAVGGWIWASNTSMFFDANAQETSILLVSQVPLLMSLINLNSIFLGWDAAFWGITAAILIVEIFFLVCGVPILLVFGWIKPKK